MGDRRGDAEQEIRERHAKGRWLVFSSQALAKPIMEMNIAAAAGELQDHEQDHEPGVKSGLAC